MTGTPIHTWFTNQELPGFRVALTLDGTIVNLSSGFTSSLVVVRAQTIVVTQSDNQTLYDGSGEDYNYTLDRWSAATLTAIADDLTALGKTSFTYELRPYVRRTADSADEVPTSHAPIFGTFKVAAT